MFDILPGSSNFYGSNNVFTCSFPVGKPRQLDISRQQASVCASTVSGYVLCTKLLRLVNPVCRLHHQRNCQEARLCLGKPEQKLIAPYLENKQPDDVVFSRQAAGLERKTENPSGTRGSHKRKELFDKDSYRIEIEYAINQANKILPDKEKIPHWTPYQLRHAAASAMGIEEDGIDKAQALLGHTSPNTTARYSHRQLLKTKEMARNRKDIFAEERKLFEFE